MDVNAHGEGRDVKIRSWKNNAFRSVRPPPPAAAAAAAASFAARGKHALRFTRAQIQREEEREREGGEGWKETRNERTTEKLQER